MSQAKKHRIPGLTALVAALFLTAPAFAESAEEFFDGKTLTYIVATSPGGGYDTYARLIAETMEQYLPVSKIIVKNVPGAGHIIGTNQLFAAKPDGLTIGTFNTGLIYAQLLGREGIKFDLTELTYIGKAAADPRVVVVDRKSDIKSFADLLNVKKEVKFAASGPGSASYNETKMLINALKLNVKLIPGYRGQEGEMAMMRGEVVGQLGSRSSLQPFVTNGYGRFILQIGGTKAAGMEGVALAAETITEGQGRSVVALIAAQAELARLTAAPPGVPADRAKVLIDAYRSALEDPGLQAKAEKLGIPIDPLYGEDVAGRVKQALTQSPETVAMVTAVLSEKAPQLKVTSELLKVGKKGKKISFTGKDGKTIQSKVSGSRTKVVIDDQESKRSKLKAGMVCDITYTPGGENEPSLLACK
ncbi:MAG: Bug family tripartite tricarboxylate transporter substrate binding protein [Kiloniellaceae bacterium]